MKPTLVFATANAVISAGTVTWAFFAYEHFLTSTKLAALVPLVLIVALVAPCATWFFFTWIGSRSSRRAPATATFILGLLICVFGCILVVESTTGRGIDNVGIDSWWPLHVIGASVCQCMALALPLGLVWIVVALDELEHAG